MKKKPTQKNKKKLYSKNKISAFILTFNEENFIDICLKSLDFVDEIILVDAGSTDKTLEIAKKYGARIIHDKKYGFCEPSRKLGAEKSKYDWLLNLDADEAISDELKKEILDAVANPKFDAYWIHRDDYFMGKHLKFSTRDDFVLRLHKKESVIYTPEIHNGVHLAKKAKVGRLKHSILHADVSWQRNLSKLKKTAKLHALTVEKYNAFPRKYFGVFYTPIYYFITNYFLNLGFLDGIPGFMNAYSKMLYELHIYYHVWFKNN